jgi:hypothetical protein
MRHHVTPIHRRWANGPVARQVDPERARWVWGLFASLLLAAAPFATYLFKQNECVRLSYQASELREKHERLLERERRLRMQRSALQSLEAIETWAMERHGLVRPSSEQVIVVHRSPPRPLSVDGGPH